MNITLLEKIKRRIDSSVEDLIDLQRRLTAIPALAPENGGQGEQAKAEHLLAYLKDSGFKDIRKFCAPDPRVPQGCRPNLIATIPGRNKDRTIWILTHLDVVPPGELSLWSSDPYSVRVVDGRIFGRGTEDNQQDLVASIAAAKAFIDEGATPENSIGLAFVADEETGSRWGLIYLLEAAKDLFRAQDLIVVPDSGNETGSMIEVAEKSMLWIRFKTTGKQCHASRPHLGRNAFRAASHLVVKLKRLFEIFDASDPLYDFPRTSTFEPTRKDANVPNINTIPGEDIFYMDCRVLPRYPLASVKEAMRKIVQEVEKEFGVTIELSPVQEVEAPPPTPIDAPVVLALKKAILDVYGIEAFPAGIGGGTVAAPFREKGFPAAVWCRIGQSAHQPDEYCLIENMVGNAKVYAHLFLQG